MAVINTKMRILLRMKPVVIRIRCFTVREIDDQIYIKEVKRKIIHIDFAIIEAGYYFEVQVCTQQIDTIMQQREGVCTRVKLVD